MQNDFMLLKNLVCFLYLFDLKLEERVFERNIIDVLYSKRPIILLDKDNNAAGKLYVKDNNIIIKASILDKQLKAIGNNKEDEDLYCFDYVISNNDKDRLQGSYKVEKNKITNGVISKNLVGLYENNELVLRIILDTIRNKIKIYDNKNNVKLKYINDYIKMLDKNVKITVENKDGYITYELLKEDENNKIEKKGRIYGYSDITRSGYEVEEEFGLILREIYDGYLDFLEKTKESVNEYIPSLFEKISCMSLKSMDKEKINSILNVDYYQPDKIFVRKYRNKK